MRYIETPSGLRLRPNHLLLMMYRYVSGVYEIGDLSALNYTKGFLDGSGGRDPRTVLTVSGHGIGEPEMWIAERIPGCEIETMSFRLLDTQLLQFLRSATREDIEAAFDRLSRMVAPFAELSRLAADPGLVPYWVEQSEILERGFDRWRLTVYSDSPLRIPAARRYDLIYVSQGSYWFSLEAAEVLRRRLNPGGLLVVLMPARPPEGEPAPRFADSEPVAEAKRVLRSVLESRGYTVDFHTKPLVDLQAMAARRERIAFSVLAPASAVLLGELILASLNEHISDVDRLEAMEEAARRFPDLEVPVHEELELSIVEAE